MYCQHLQLGEFRNYQQLELDLPSGISAIQGENASGKTTLLEAIYMLATTRSPRTSTDYELINSAASTDFGPPFARVSSQIIRRQGTLSVELTIARDDTRPADLVSPHAPPVTFNAPVPVTRKRIKVNNVPRRAVDLIGLVNVVLFTPQDVDLVTGEPSLRRRYLDITISQVDHRYVRALSAYNKIIMQRNALLRQLRESGRNPLSVEVREEMRYWDGELTTNGAYIMLRRDVFIARLSRLAAEIHAQLVGTDAVENAPARLSALYTTTVAPEMRRVIAPEIAAHWAKLREDTGHYAAGDEVQEAKLRARIPNVDKIVTNIAAEFMSQLEKARADEVRRAVSIIGPHRDDVRFMLGAVSLAAFGSRGQQRTAVLALKLAEVSLMRAETGDSPILLLDDIFSELDARRRNFLMRTLLQPIDAGDRPPQVLITATDWASFDPTFLSGITRYEVQDGALQKL